MRTRVTSFDEVPERGSFLFTVLEPDGREEEVILVRCADEEDEGVRAWKNYCLHEPDQRLDRGVGTGAAMRDGEIICPRHGSMYDACSGHCDDGEAAGTDLVAVDVELEDGDVYLTDDALRFKHQGSIDEDDDLPGSTSHLSF
jgi:nitrite reductase/ring-hydroxylating ferredoxin subunit